MIVQVIFPYRILYTGGCRCLLGHEYTFINMMAELERERALWWNCLASSSLHVVFVYLTFNIFRKFNNRFFAPSSTPIHSCIQYSSCIQCSSCIHNRPGPWFIFHSFLFYLIHVLLWEHIFIFLKSQKGFYLPSIDRVGMLIDLLSTFFLSLDKLKYTLKSW